ncbi:hypothetical protein E2320_007265, partial [Naja naja]
MQGTGSPPKSPGWAASLRTQILDPDPDPVEGRGAALALPESPPLGRPLKRLRTPASTPGAALGGGGVTGRRVPTQRAAPTSRKRRRSALPSFCQVSSGPAAAFPYLLLLSAALGPVAAMETFTPGTLEALNGTDVRLKCTFRSPVPAGPKLTVSWYFQSELKEPLEAVSPLA